MLLPEPLHFLHELACNTLHVLVDLFNQTIVVGVGLVLCNISKILGAFLKGIAIGGQGVELKLHLSLDPGELLQPGVVAIFLIFHEQ